MRVGVGGLRANRKNKVPVAVVAPSVQNAVVYVPRASYMIPAYTGPIMLPPAVIMLDHPAGTKHHVGRTQIEPKRRPK